MPQATRIGDADEPHDGVPIFRDEGSLDVFVNGIGWSRQGDLNAPPHAHRAPIALGSTTVFVNGLGAGRVGDAVTSCTSVMEGSDNVYAGP